MNALFLLQVALFLLLSLCFLLISSPSFAPKTQQETPQTSRQKWRKISDKNRRCVCSRRKEMNTHTHTRPVRVQQQKVLSKEEDDELVTAYFREEPHSQTCQFLHGEVDCHLVFVYWHCLYSSGSIPHWDYALSQVKVLQNLTCFTFIFSTLGIFWF